MLKKAQAEVQKTSRQNVTSTVFDFFLFSVILMDVMGGKITINSKELPQNRKSRNTCTPEKSQKCTEYRKDARITTATEHKSGVLGQTGHVP